MGIAGRLGQIDTLRRLAVIVCLWTFGLMMLGGYVKAIHAGLACPDWPQCYGQWLPPFEDPDGQFDTHMIMAEWTHRLVASLLGPLLLTFTYLTWRNRDHHPVVRYTPLAAVGVLGVQVILGGLTVTEGLNALIVVSHLGTATIFLTMMVVAAVMLYVHPFADPTRNIDETMRRRGRTADGVWREPRSSEPKEVAPAPAEARTLRATIADYVSMTKPRVMGLLILTSVTAMFLAAGGLPPFWPTLGVVVGGALATGGSGAINHFVERDLDTKMERTKNRPVASGRVSPGAALTFGASLGSLAFLFTWHFANLLAAFFAICGLLFYVFIYTLWLKRTTYLNIVIGGAAGGFPALVGWAAVDGTVGWAAWLFFMLIVVWTPPHFWALALVIKDDYGRASVPMLPVVKGVPRTTREILAYSVVTVAMSFGFYVLKVVGLVYLFTAALLGGLFLVLALHLHQEPNKTTARRMFGYSILYLGLLYVAAFLDVTLSSLA